MILKIIDHFGSQKLLALSLGVDKSAVSRWVNECYVPPLRAIEIERLTEGKFLAVDIVDANLIPAGGAAHE